MLLGLVRFQRPLNRGGLQHGAADLDGAAILGSWPALWLARFCPISQRSGLVVGRPRLWWPWCFPLRLRELWPLRRWLWQRFFPLRLWECGVLRRIRACPSCVSRGSEARLCCTAGRIWRHQSCISSETSCSGSAESSQPSSLAKGLVTTQADFDGTPDASRPVGRCHDMWKPGVDAPGHSRSCSHAHILAVAEQLGLLDDDERLFV